jgi:hypothetical protein
LNYLLPPPDEEPDEPDEPDPPELLDAPPELNPELREPPLGVEP